MEAKTLAFGIVKSFDNQYALAGVTVTAYLPEGFPNLPGAALSEPLELAVTTTDTAGNFTLRMDPHSPAAAYGCYLEHCSAPGMFLCAYDLDGSLLAKTELAYLAEAREISLELHPTDWVPTAEDWQIAGRLLHQAQIMTLDRLVEELTSLTPAGIFAGWTITKRLGYLQTLENALLDPDGQLRDHGLSITMSTVQDPELNAAFRQQVAHSSGLGKVFDNAVLRAELVGGHLGATELLLDPRGFEEGDVKIAVNRFIGHGLVEAIHHDQPGLDYFGHFPWLRSPLAGYRDYLVDIWVKRATQQIQRQPLDAKGAVKQLNNRFHQDFNTSDTTQQPANRLVNGILQKILTAPAGNGFGFGLAAASIEGQGERTDREYLDYLISKTGETVRELENRYRLNLSRSDLDQSSAVQQNIDTLQRFFTDSFHSPFDPIAILPPLTGNGLPIINEHTYPNHSNGPFFWQYEEWVERNEPFYAENYFDIRKTFKVFMSDAESQKSIWGRTMPLQQFAGIRLNSPQLHQFTPPKTASPSTYAQEQKIGDQWARNLMELQDLVNDAHKDFFAGFFPEAERKYVELMKLVDHLNILVGRWKGTAWDHYQPAKFAAEQRAMAIKDPDALEKFEQKYHLTVGYWLSGNTGQSWLNSTSIARVAYLMDMLLQRLLPACLSETRQALAKYRETVQGGTAPFAYDAAGYPRMETNLATLAQLWIFSGPTPTEPGAKVTPAETVWWPPFKANTGSLPYSSETTVEAQNKLKRDKMFFPANTVEKAYFRLKLGDALLEWADLLYRTDRPESINRARELYKAVLFLHGEDPDIAPSWGEWQWWKFKPFGVGKLTQNPQFTTQVNRAQIGFEQINSGLNYYGFAKDHVPPVRYRVLQEAAESFAASAKSMQNDYLSYMQKYEQAVLDEMTAGALVEKASYAIQIAEEQVQIAQFNVGEAVKQVEAVKAQIEAKKKEIKDSESFFSQLGDFFSGMKDAAKGLGENVMNSMSNGNGEAAGNGKVDYAALYKVISSKGSTSTATAGLTGSMAIMAGYGAFVYAGVTSMQSLEAAGNKRMAELKGLQEGALPAAEKMVEMKKKEVKIAGLQKAIAQADYNFGQKLLAFYDYRFLSKAFWQQMSGFANRLLRRYLDLGGRTAWFAERALSFEIDKEVRIVSFNYFPKHLRGVTGADTLQLHLAEMEATRIFGLSQTIPVKQTFSMVRDFPIAFGQLKKHGTCRFQTSEAALRLAYPGVYGYRLRSVSVGTTYTDEIMPHKGLLSNNGYSTISRHDGSTHRLLRYPDALPLSEFNMRGDMFLYDLPDETLLPFEGSGCETDWYLRLSRIGDSTSLEKLTDVLFTLDMRASYSVVLDAKHQASLPATWKKSLLISGKVQNPGAVSKFKKEGGVLSLSFYPVLAAGNSLEKMRKVTMLAVILSGVEASPISATLTADTDGLSANFNLIDGVAMTNSGFLALANGGVPLPLNILTGISGNQPFTLTIDSAVNPGVDFSKMYDVQMVVEYEAQV